jgi:hypothetical protein
MHTDQRCGWIVIFDFMLLVLQYIGYGFLDGMIWREHRPRLASPLILTPGTSAACRRYFRLCSREAQVRGALRHGFDAEFDVLIQVHIQSGYAIHNTVAAWRHWIGSVSST